VPETSIDKNRDASVGEHKIRSAPGSDDCSIDPEAQPKSVNRPPQGELTRRITLVCELHSVPHMLG
jgi:hypothetical protein